MKRERPNWDEYFMGYAFWTATRSSCLHIHTGSIIVIDNTVISEGYNGAPRGVPNCLEVGCRKEQDGLKYNEKGESRCRGVHAERNAIDNAKRETLANAILYTKYFPCSTCAKGIINAEIKRIVYCYDYREPGNLAEELFQQARIKAERVSLTNEEIYKFLQSVKSRDEK